MGRHHKRIESGEGLHDLPVFADCSEKAMRRLANLGTHITVAAGHWLTKTGIPGTEVLMVVSGQATCLVRGVEEARFGPGDFFGEVAALDGGPRTASVIADTDMEILVFTGNEFEMLVKSSPEVAHRILKAMAHRLRRANDRAVA
jgi:CRP/FNR family cyclic AMP-dependent transcriptional regulator